MKVLVQGWRFIPHSYALVNSFQCMAFMRRPSMQLWHEDVPFFRANWPTTQGLFEKENETSLRSIPLMPAGETPDVVYRISFPFNLNPSAAGKTVVFATSEHQVVPDSFIVGGLPVAAVIARDSRICLVTPSNWSSVGFREAGVLSSSIHIVPHGIDPNLFHPADAGLRSSIRRRMGIEKQFAFLHVGAMTGNKNVVLLLKAFAAVVERHPEVHLVLKGLDEFYSSQEALQMAGSSLTQSQIAAIQPRTIFSGAVHSCTQMAELYQSADAYVSPYKAEGFNLPALEAAACGCPLICSAGGATDDFTLPTFCLPVETRIIPMDVYGTVGRVLDVNFDSLVAQMCRMVTDHSFRNKAAKAAVEHVHSHFTWDHVVDQLHGVFLQG